MDWVEFFKHFAAYSLVSTFLFGWLLYARTKNTNSTRISYSATTSKTNYLLLGFGITISASLLAANVYGYMLQRTAIASSFYWLFGIVLATLYIAAWIPATSGIKYNVHYWAGGVRTYIMFAIVALLFVDSYENFYKGSSMVNGWMYVVGLALLVLLVLGAIFTNLPNLSQRKSLHSQQFLYILFILAFVTRVYLA